MSARPVQTSKFLSYVLRHNPDALGLSLEPGGWIDVEALVDAAQREGRSLSRSRIEEAMQASDKDRFSFSEDGTKIRANYGHSIDVDLDVQPTAPPEHLFHGTARQALSAIREEGLRPQSRQYVHLSENRSDAREVGQRHGTPVVLRIRAAALHEAGQAFYRAARGVWLTAHVPPAFIDGPDTPEE